MALTKAAQKLLTRSLVEAMDSGDVGHQDLQKWLCDAVGELADPGEYCYLVDFIGDGESGDVIYCCCGDLCKAPYTITTVNGKIAVGIDEEQSVDVLPHTTYEEEADESDHYLAMFEAKIYTKGSIPLCERFISKTSRDKADSGSFAGKNKSFPILKAADVMAAVRSIGRSGSDNYDAPTLKSNIIRIAKDKGFAGSLPKSWQKGGDPKESAATMESKLAEVGARHSAADIKAIQGVHDHSVALGAECAVPQQESAASEFLQQLIPGIESGAIKPEGYRLIECAAAAEPIVLREARSDYQIKLIAPGKGSSAYYTPEVLKRDGPMVFPKDTKIYLNHATAAEEAARPEGDVNNLAGVTTAPAQWMESHPKGPGLYAPATFFPDHAATVEAKAPFVGMSIRGYGDIETTNGKPVMREGVPLLKRLTAAKSVDVVTEAGAGGMILTESARTQIPTEEGADDMDAAEFKALQESNAALLSEMKKIRERQSLEEASTHVASYLQTVQVAPVIQEQVARRLKERFMIPGGLPVTATGELDTARIKTLAESEANDEIAFLKKVNPRLVVGMGATAGGSQLTEAQIKEQRETQNKSVEETNQRFESALGFSEASEHARRILREGRCGFDVNYNSRTRGANTQSGGTLTLEGGR